MAAAYLAGTSGRLKAVAITPVLTTDTITWAGATVTIAEITEWTLTVTSVGGAPKSLTFESSTTAQGKLVADLLRGGVEEWSFDIKGQYNVGDPSMVTLGDGVAVKADFIKKKVTTAGNGYIGCNGVIENFQDTGVSVQGGVQMFSAKFAGSGLLPAYA